MESIDKITTAGKLTEFALPKCGERGGTPQGITEGSEGDLWYTAVSCDKIGKMTPAGVTTEYGAGPNYPRDITTGPEGDLWYTSWWGEASHVVKMTKEGVISTEYALQGDSDPAGITVGPNKNIWIAAGSDIATIEP